MEKEIKIVVFLIRTDTYAVQKYVILHFWLISRNYFLFSIQKNVFNIKTEYYYWWSYFLRHVESIALNLYLKLFASLQIFRYARAPQVNVVFIVTYIDRHIYPSHVKHMVPENCTIFTPAFDYPRMWHGSRTHYFPHRMSCTIL